MTDDDLIRLACEKKLEGTLGKNQQIGGTYYRFYKQHSRKYVYVKSGFSGGKTTNLGEVRADTRERCANRIRDLLSEQDLSDL